MSKASNSLPQLEWKGENKRYVFPTKRELESCMSFKKSGLALLGASHHRFSWDYVASLYFPEVQLWSIEQKHYTGALENVYYGESTSAGVLLTSLKKLTSSMCISDTSGCSLQESSATAVQIGATTRLFHSVATSTTVLSVLPSTRLLCSLFHSSTQSTSCIVLLL